MNACGKIGRDNIKLDITESPIMRETAENAADIVSYFRVCEVEAKRICAPRITIRVLYKPIGMILCELFVGMTTKGSDPNSGDETVFLDLVGKRLYVTEFFICLPCAPTVIPAFVDLDILNGEKILFLTKRFHILAHGIGRNITSVIVP